MRGTDGRLDGWTDERALRRDQIRNGRWSIEPPQHPLSAEQSRSGHLRQLPRSLSVHLSFLFLSGSLPPRFLSNSRSASESPSPFVTLLSFSLPRRSFILSFLIVFLVPRLRRRSSLLVILDTRNSATANTRFLPTTSATDIHDTFVIQNFGITIITLVSCMSLDLVSLRGGHRGTKVVSIDRGHRSNLGRGSLPSLLSFSRPLSRPDVRPCVLNVAFPPRLFPVKDKRCLVPISG